MQRAITIYSIFSEITHRVSFRVLAKKEQNDERVGGQSCISMQSKLVATQEG